MSADVVVYCSQVDVGAGKCLAEYLRNSRLTPHVRILENRLEFNVPPACGSLVLVGAWQGEAEAATWWQQIPITPICVMAVLPNGPSVAPLPDRFRTARLVHFEHSIQELDPIAEILSVFLEVAVLHQQSSRSRAISTFQDPEALMESTIGTYNDSNYAERYYQTWKDNIPVAQLESLLRRVPKGARILDAGCGPGHHSHWLAALGYEVVGVDLSHAALAIAQQSQSPNRRPRFLRHDMRRLLFEENTFDAIWASASCIHVPGSQLNTVLGNFSRVLRPGGYLGITMQVGRLAALEEDGRYFEGYVDGESITRALKGAQLTVKNVTQDLSAHNTRGLKHLVRWAATVAQKKAGC